MVERRQWLTADGKHCVADAPAITLRQFRKAASRAAPCQQALKRRSWHADLIQCASRPIPGCPAILPASVAQAANESRRFHHIAMRDYGGFDPGLARPAVQAARLLADGPPSAVAMFRQCMDPE